jgi:cytoskeletal protein CcmA (bactofilin family)
VTGDIRVAQTGNVSLAIGLTGVVQGDIHAQRLIVGGRINGNVFVTESVELHDSADIHGDITYGQISIEPGAKINGRMVTQANAQHGELTTEGQPTLVQSASNQALPAPASD